MVRNAAAIIPAYHRFAFSGRHHDYGRDAFAKRRRGEAGAPFWGYRPGERAFAIGDVLLTRCGGPDGGEETALAREPSAIAQVLVSVRPDHVLAIGGDVHGSVRLSRLGRTEPGSPAGDGSVILHLSNRADEAG